MTIVALSGLAGADKEPPAHESDAVLADLRKMIEALPTCVMRVDLDGCVLAANDSAQQLMGVAELGLVLGKSLTAQLTAEYADEWRAFLARTWSDGAGSIECELVDFSGAHRVLLVKAVAHPDHHDGIQSLVLTAQDAGWRRRLEAALGEHQDCAAAIERLQRALEESEAERQCVTAALELARTDLDAAAGKHHEALAALEHKIQDEGQRQAANQEQHEAVVREWEQRCNDLGRQLAHGLVEQQRLASMTEDMERTLTQLRGAAAGSRQEIELVRADCERERIEVEQTLRLEIEALRGQTRELGADRERMLARLEQQDADLARLSAEPRTPRQPSAEGVSVNDLMKSVTAYRVELLQITGTIRNLEPMATIGRVAMASSRELKAAIQAIDDRSKQLLAGCALNDANRPHIEALRGEAIEAASLVRQMGQIFRESAPETAGGNALPPSD